MAQTIDLVELENIVAKMRELGIRHLSTAGIELELGPAAPQGPIEAAVEQYLDNTRRGEAMGLTEAEQDALFGQVVEPTGRKT